MVVYAGFVNIRYDIFAGHLWAGELLVRNSAVSIGHIIWVRGSYAVSTFRTVVPGADYTLPFHPATERRQRR